MVNFHLFILCAINVNQMETFPFVSSVHYIQIVSFSNPTGAQFGTIVLILIRDSCQSNMTVCFNLATTNINTYNNLAIVYVIYSIVRYLNLIITATYFTPLKRHA